MTKILDLPAPEGPQSPSRRSLLTSAVVLGAAGVAAPIITNIAHASQEIP